MLYTFTELLLVLSVYTPIMVICEIVSSLAIVISAPFAFSQTGYPGMKEILLYTAFLP